MSTHERMQSAAPPYYRESRQANAGWKAHASEIDRRRTEARDLLNQMTLTNATWALENYEAIFGVKPNPNQSVEERRSILLAKMRGARPVTIESLKNTAESFYGGEIDVIKDYVNYTVHFKFKSNVGAPTNVEDVRHVLRDIVPAHIAFDFLYTYLLIREVEGVKTLSDMEKIPLNQFAGA